MTVRNSSLSISMTQSFYSHLAMLIPTGFAMFAMFFGSGNLVFPIQLGSMVEGNYWFAIVGLFLTAVCVPFLGVYGIYLFEGSYEAFFQRLGKLGGFIVPLVVLALIGPFGAIPRCITVAHGSLALLFPNFPFILFSILMCAVVFLLTLDSRKIVMLIGAVMTPFLLISLAFIAIQGIRMGHLPAAQMTSHSAISEFSTGFIQGYFTMDLVAGFFFATVIIKYIKFNIEEKLESKSHQNMIILGAMGIGGFLLALIYIAFVYLGAAYADILPQQNPEQYIVAISQQVLGSLASPFVATAVMLAVLTTAVTLTSIAASFLRNQLFSQYVYTPVATLIILGISFSVSTLKFTGIAAILGPILVVLYPGLVVLTILNVLHRTYNIQIVKTPVYATFAITALWKVFF